MNSNKGFALGQVEFKFLPPEAMAAIMPLHIAMGLLFPDQMVAVREIVLQRAESAGKFQKWQVLYTPITPILPAAYFYECSTCHFFNSKSSPQDAWQPGITRPVSQNTCSIVRGTVSPYAWCGLWMPADAFPAMTWLSYTTPVPAPPQRIAAYNGI